MIKEPVLASWTNMEDSLFIILILRKYIQLEDIHFVKGYRYALIGNPDRPGGALTYHEYFFIHDDCFDIILKTDQNSDISIKVIH